MANSTPPWVDNLTIDGGGAAIMQVDSDDDAFRVRESDNVTINGLLPGPFETDRIEEIIAGEAKAKGISLDEARKSRMASNPAGRFGRPEEFGAACGCLCSDYAGFVTGQNILLDGGNFPGTL